MSERIRFSQSLRAGLLMVLFALTAWAAAGGRATQPPSALLPPRAPRVEVAFVLDTTGSMAGLIDGAKRKIWSIANQLATGQPRPVVRMALVGYRDRGDAYVTRVHDLTDDIDAVYADLQSFTADGGGDTPESVNQALHEAVTRLAWSSDTGVYRVIFLVGDAPPHLDYPSDVPYTQSVALARQRGIVVNTVQCGDLAITTPIWRQIAASGAGEFAAIRQDGGMLALATPMDEELAALSRDLADTLVPYGALSERRELEAKRDHAASAEPSALAERLGFLSKLGGRLNSGRTDLVDALAAGALKLADVAESDLPPEMQPMAPEARAAFVERKLERRQRVQARIDDLSAQRDAYVAQESARRAASGNGDGFDIQVLRAVREQAAAAGIAY